VIPFVRMEGKAINSIVYLRLTQMVQDIIIHRGTRPVGDGNAVKRDKLPFSRDTCKAAHEVAYYLRAINVRDSAGGCSEGRSADS
jgi:hypothetical protein